MDANNITAIIIALVGSAAGIVSLVRQLRRDAHEQPYLDNKAAIETANSAMDTVQRMQARIDEQDKRLTQQDRIIREQGDRIEAQGEEIEQLRAENKHFADGANMLIDQLIKNQLTPVWRPANKYRPAATVE